MSTICPDRPADIIPPVSTEIASAVEVDSRPATVAVEASTSYVVDCNEGIIKLFRTAFSRELNCRSVTVEPDVIVIHVSSRNTVTVDRENAVTGLGAVHWSSVSQTALREYLERQKNASSVK